MSFETHLLSTFEIQNGHVFHNVPIAFKTFGTLNSDKSNVIIYPTWYSGFISDNEWLIGENMALNPSKYFIIIIAMINNSQSFSSENNPITIYDNVMAQYRLIKEKWNIEKIKLVTGWSMGAQQTYQWACLFPDMVENIVPFCGSARTSPHNFVFLEGLRNILNLRDDEERLLKVFARDYAGWGLSQPFYKQEKWRQLGFNSLEEFLTGFWEKFFLLRKKENLLAHIWTWQYGDISDNPIFNKDFKYALYAIKAKTIIIAPEIDLYFPKEDNMEEVELISDCHLEIIPGVWGHFAGGGINQDDTKFIDNILKKVLS